MPTAGKVLTVLVMLVAVVWVLLTATVAQLNRNGTKAVEDLQKQVAQYKGDVKLMGHDVQAIKDATYHEQFLTQNDLSVLQVRQADTEKARSEVMEIGSRVAIQVADAEGMDKSAKALLEVRKTEKKDETKALADARESVQKLKAENEEYLSRLTTERDKFRSRLRENKALAERLRKAGGGPTTHAASFPR